MGVGESSLSVYGAAFSGNTNTEPKLAMMTLDISASPLRWMSRSTSPTLTAPLS